MKHISKFLVIGMLAPTAYAAGVSEKMDVTSRIYGQINRVGAYVNDGHQHNWLFSDNDHDSTKLGAEVATPIDNCITVGGQLELELQKGRGYLTNQINRTGDVVVNGVRDDSIDVINVKYTNAWVKHQIYGTLTLGRLATASEGSGEISMAATKNIGYAGVADMAPGIIFHDKASSQAVTFNPLTDTNRITGNFDAIDGFYIDRKNAIKYTSPELFESVTLAASFGNFDASRDYVDASAWFNKQFSDVSVEAAVAIGKTSHGAKEQARSFANTSAGVLHDATGWNVSASCGKEKNDFTGTFAKGNTTATKKHQLHYLQLGKRNDFFHIGSTNFAVDYYKGKHSTQADDKSKAYGFVVEQKISKIDGAVFAGVRKYDYQRTATKYDKSTVLAVGLKVGFEIKSS